MIVDIKNRTSVDTGENNFNHCHSFTRAVILGIFHNGELNPQLTQFMGELRLAGHNDTILPVYAAMLRETQDSPQMFDQAAMGAVVHAPGLILFSAGPVEASKGLNIQHSMIVIGQDIWQGANNTFSLGAVDDNVYIYPGMSTRMHNYGKIGGWADDGKMCSIFDAQASNKRYTMYYIPL